MDETVLMANIRTTKEFLLDEQRLVTYTSLSKELCIHVNEAKTLLNRVILDIRQSEPNAELNVCYIVSGLLDNKSACTTVCPETELDSLRKKMLVTFFEHVYCVSKKTQSIDNVSLAAMNTFEDFSLCIGHIKDSSCIKRTENELVKLRNEKPNIPVEPKSALKSAKTANKENNCGTIEIKKEPSNQTKVEVKTEVKSPKKVITTKNPSPVKKPSSKPTKGIAGFFKQSGDAIKTDKSNGSSNIPIINNVDSKKTNKCDADSEKDLKKREFKAENVIVKTEPTVEETKIASKSKKKPNKETNGSQANSLTDIKKNGRVDKKRKRLIHVSDSESDTETNDLFADEKMSVDHESEDEIPPTPTVNSVKITSGMINPKKKRKIVDKTYTDEDGYILTKKEEVYESCSDTEDNNVPAVGKTNENTKVQETVKQPAKTVTSPKENGKGKKKKVSPPKGKQSMMTNFFKKV